MRHCAVILLLVAGCATKPSEGPALAVDPEV